MARRGAGFLIAPSGGQVFSGKLSLRVTSGADVDVNLRSGAASATTVFFDTPAVHVTAAPTTVNVHAATASSALNDAVIEAVSGATVLASFSLTVVQKPTLRFSGRFQCRLATDPDPFNSPFGMNSSFGMYAVQGPDPANPDEPPLDRIVRLQDPVALRLFCEPVGASVTAIESQIGASAAAFKVGDPVLGQLGALVPTASSKSQDGAFAQPGFEPISGFEFHVGTLSRARPWPQSLETKVTRPGRTAPYADGLFKLDEVGPWKPSDFGYPEPTWAKHATAVTTAKKAALLAQAGYGRRDANSRPAAAGAQ